MFYNIKNNVETLVLTENILLNLSHLTTYLFWYICFCLRMATTFISCLTIGTINRTYFICKALVRFCHLSIIALLRTFIHYSLYQLPLFFDYLKKNSFLSNDKKLFLLQHYLFPLWMETFIPWKESFNPFQNCFIKNLKRIFPDIKTFSPYPKCFHKLMKTFCMLMKTSWRHIKTFCELKVAALPGTKTFLMLMKTFRSLMKTFQIRKAIPIPGRECSCSIKKHSISLKPPALSIQKVFISLNIPFGQGGELFGSIQKVFVSIKHLFVSLKHLFITLKKVIDKGIEHSFQGANELFLITISPQQGQNCRLLLLFFSEIGKTKGLFNKLCQKG